MFYITGVIAHGSFTLRGIFFTFYLFCSTCDLDLDRMTFIYELDMYSMEIYRVCNYVAYFVCYGF